MNSTITDRETYNGWLNRPTWNAHLWLTDNDETTYYIAKTIARHGNVDRAARAIEMLCRESWGGRTPDGDALAQVDWLHIAEALREGEI